MSDKQSLLEVILAILNELFLVMRDTKNREECPENPSATYMLIALHKAALGNDVGKALAELDRLQVEFRDLALLKDHTHLWVLESSPENYAYFCSKRL